MRSPEHLPSKIHLVGAGGAGMSGLAKILSQLGHRVSGSDLKPGRALDSLRDVGVEVWVGHDPDRAISSELVVASSAVPARDPELYAAREAGIPVWRRPKLLGAITEATPTVGLAGTHGKTTSTALAVSVMEGAGLDPSFLVGGEVVGKNTGAHVGTDDVFVLEADEAFGTFRHISLDAALVTNIEADHLDYYGTVTAMEDAFAQVVDRVSGPRLACIDDAGVKRLAMRSDITTYGFDQDADWVISGLAHEGGRSSFRLDGPTTHLEVMLPKPGIHLASNAAGVLALLVELGHDPEGLAEGLSTFAGVRRRYEVRAMINGITIVDDYAHHPTEVEATIAATRLGGEGRVVAVFQPHRYSRTADLGPQFGEPLALADLVVVNDVYAAGERPIIGVSGRLVAQAAEAAGASVTYVPKLADVTSLLVPQLREGDTVLLLGAGDVTTLAPALAAAIGDEP